MKKIFLYSVMALFMCLFAACSQEEIVSEGGQGGNKVTLSVKVPGAGPVGRAADLTVDGYTMQCIMELVDTEGKLIADSRQVTDVTNGKASFEFDKPSGEYTCLFWAEYLNTDGKSFYNTSEGLTAVVYDGNKKNELFNNKAADAFCGKITSANISAGINVILKRPFARIAVSKTALANLGSNLNQFTASINGAQGYNVATGTTSKAVTLSPAVGSVVSVPATGDHAFFCFVFPYNSTVTKGSEIKFSNNEKPDEVKTLTITASQLENIDSNTAINLKPDTETGSDNIKVEIEINNEFETGGGTTPETPATAVKVGDYLYADGTWGTEATNAVAVVYHVGADENDKSTYSMLSKVNGYAVALADAATEIKYAEGTFANPTNINGAEQTPSNNKSGYLNSHLTIEVNGTAYNQLPPVKAALDYSVALTAGKTSGWYLPTVAQLEEIRSANLTTINMTASNYWSSVIATTGKIYRACFNSEDNDYTGSNKASNANVTFNVRAIVTF